MTRAKSLRPRTLYTLVQHSGFVVGGKPAFKNAVELSSVEGAAVDRINKVGGRLFDTYAAAYDAEMNVNYPPTNNGLIPTARGTFKTVRGVDSPVFIPA